VHPASRQPRTPYPPRRFFTVLVTVFVVPLTTDGVVVVVVEVVVGVVVGVDDD
jgi:hypothetical protein